MSVFCKPLSTCLRVTAVGSSQIAIGDRFPPTGQPVLSPCDSNWMLRGRGCCTINFWVTEPLSFTVRMKETLIIMVSNHPCCDRGKVTP